MTTAITPSDALEAVLPGEAKYHPTEHQLHFAALAVVMGPAEIAETLSVDIGVVRRILRQPAVRREMARLNAETAAELDSYKAQCRAALSDALMAVVAVLADSQALPSDKIRAAQFLADRCGLPKVTKAEVNVHKQTLTGTEILAARDAALKAQREGRALQGVEPIRADEPAVEAKNLDEPAVDVDGPEVLI